MSNAHASDGNFVTFFTKWGKKKPRLLGRGHPAVSIRSRFNIEKVGHASSALGRMRIVRVLIALACWHAAASAPAKPSCASQPFGYSAHQPGPPRTDSRNSGAKHFRKPGLPSASRKTVPVTRHCPPWFLEVPKANPREFSINPCNRASHSPGQSFRVDRTLGKWYVCRQGGDPFKPAYQMHSISTLMHTIRAKMQCIGPVMHTKPCIATA
jgi:hypothetical protein